MSNLIRISDAFSLIDERGAKLGITSTNRCNFKDILRLVKPIDAVEIVRCKNCEHSYDDLGGLTCSKGPCVDRIVPEDFYCPYGEKEEL